MIREQKCWWHCQWKLTFCWTHVLARKVSMPALSSRFASASSVIFDCCSWWDIDISKHICGSSSSYYNIDEQCLTVDNLVCLSSRYFSRVTMLVIMAVFLKIFIKVLLKLFDHTLSAWQIFFKSEAEWWGGGGADSGRGGRGLTYDTKWLFYICNICNIWNICHVHLSTTI